MKKQDAIEAIRDNGYDVAKTIAFIEGEIARYRTSWQVVDIDFVYCKTSVDYTRCGYRKNTDGQYVPNNYRRNFGWKNTYYQGASLKIYLGIRDFNPRHRPLSELNCPKPAF